MAFILTKMITILSILGIVIFIVGAYFMGNAVLKTFYDDFVEQLMASIYGILLWIGVGVVILLCFGVYIGVRMLLLNVL